MGSQGGRGLGAAPHLPGSKENSLLFLLCTEALQLWGGTGPSVERRPELDLTQAVTEQEAGGKRVPGGVWGR